MQSRQTFLYIYLTSAITISLVLLSNLIRVPYPVTSKQVTTRIDGPFRLFDHEDHLARYDSLRIEIRTHKFRLSEYYKQAADSTQKRKLLIRPAIFYSTQSKTISFLSGMIPNGILTVRPKPRVRG
ncbi:MAG: hypothetical protein HC880_01310 [Bacteroidia bacterium]|nr:hypothetical protein [Bacteroidia bacterium]